MRWRRDKLWEAAGCGRAAQHDEEKSVAPAQGGPKQRAISWHTAGLTAASCGGLSGSAGALQAAVGLCRARAFPLGQEVLGHSMAQGRWISGLQGTLQVFLSRHPTLLCPHEHPVLPTPSAPPPNLQHPKCTPTVIQALPPLHGHCLSTQVQASTAPALTPKGTGAPTACSLGACSREQCKGLSGCP